VVLPGTPFVLTQDEADLASPVFSDGRAKNISLASDGAVRGAAADPDARGRLSALMGRYRAWAEDTLMSHAPSYAPALQCGRASLRTREVAEGAESPRKDDRRLHVDAFASQPTGGKRILRVFTNVNPEGQTRDWQIGEAFETHAERWLGRLRRPLPGEAWLLQRTGITRARRTPYDAVMLGLHDAAKLDVTYQREAPRRDVAFPAGASWIVFTDAVVHAALRGRYLLEQTFYLSSEALARPEASPLCILENLPGRTLI